MISASTVAIIKDLQLQLVNLDNFTKSEGWKLFDAAFEAAEKNAYQSMVTSASPHEMAKQAGAYHAIKNVRTWPERQRTAAQAQIAAMLNEGKR